MQEQTRARLLDAAVAVCSEHGLQAAAVEEIAERAGYSTGAIYSNFAGKDDLLLAAFEERLEPRLRSLAQPMIEAKTAAAQGREMARFVRALLREERPYLLLLCEFWSYAARNAVVGERFADVRRSRRAAIKEMIDARVKRHNLGLKIPSSQLADGFVALAIGVLFEAIADPALDAERLHESIFSLLAEASVDNPST